MSNGIEIQTTHLAWGDNYQRRVNERGGETGQECVICGRQTSGNARQVNVSVYGRVVAPGTFAEDGSDADDQGWFPVGSECAKSLPAGWAQ